MYNKYKEIKKYFPSEVLPARYYKSRFLKGNGVMQDKIYINIDKDSARRIQGKLQQNSVKQKQLANEMRNLVFNTIK